MEKHASRFYTLGSDKYKISTSIFTSRCAANTEMYKIMNKNKLRIIDMYDDYHDKTYVCSDYSKFYVNRI